MGEVVDQAEEEWGRAHAATLKADADLLDRLTAEALATGRVVFARGGRTLTASISPDGEVFGVELDDYPSGSVSLILPGLDDDYRAETIRSQLGLGLMNL